MRGGDVWARPCVDTPGAPDRANRGSPFTLASEAGHRRSAAEPCHIAFAPDRLAMRRTAAERIAAWRDHGRSITGAVGLS
jgi:hypothetical protein